MIIPPDAALNVQAALLDLDTRLRQLSREISTAPAEQENILRTIEGLRQEIARAADRPSILDPLEIFMLSADVRRSTNQSITAGAAQAISYDTERVDTNDMWAVGDPTKIVFNTAGRYLIGARVRFAADATGTFRSLVLEANANLALAAQITAPPAIAFDLGVVSYELFAAGDYIRTMVAHDAAGAVNVTASNAFSPRMWAVYVGRP